MTVLYCMMLLFARIYFSSFSFFLFFNDTATTEIYTLSLHDALPISLVGFQEQQHAAGVLAVAAGAPRLLVIDRKSTRLNSSHSQISYAVFCLKKKKKKTLYKTSHIINKLDNHYISVIPSYLLPH